MSHARPVDFKSSLTTAADLLTQVPLLLYADLVPGGFKKCLNVRQRLGTRNILNNFCFHVMNICCLFFEEFNLGKLGKKIFNFRKIIFFRTMKKYENRKKIFQENKKLIYDDSTLGMKSVDLRRCHKLLPLFFGAYFFNPLYFTVFLYIFGACTHL